MADPKDVVRSLWSAVGVRDWSAVAGLVTDECIYYDACLGPSVAAKGPAGVSARVALALGPLASYENFDGRMVAEGTTVLYQHAERWEWPSGEVMDLPFVSVHEVVGDKVSLWADYWDYATLLNSAPASWLEGLATADTSWLYDATGEI